MRLTFPKAYNLRLKHDFDRVHHEGSKVVKRHWIVFYAKNSFDHVRLGISVRRKYGKAVDRNRFRRLVKEAVRLEQHKLAGYDLHFVARVMENTATARKEKKIKSDIADFVSRIEQLRVAHDS